MTAFALETLLLLFIMFVCGIVAGLMLRRARARKLAPPQDDEAPAQYVFVAKTAAPDPAQILRASMQDVPAAPEVAQGKDLLRENSTSLPADEGRGARPPEMTGLPDISSHRPPAFIAAEGGKADDLKRLKGIGPGNERKLHELGIFHFHQIAAWTPEQIAWVGSTLAFPGRVEREDWVGQAKALLEQEEGTGRA